MARGERVLVTGGAGFIGSHTCKMLSSLGAELLVFDDISTGREENLRWGTFFRGNLLNREAIRQAISSFRPTAVIHFAGAAYVGESTLDPLKYYNVNVVGTKNLLAEVIAQKVERLIFSSTCATYGIPLHMPINEYTPQQPVNPYGNSKLAAERLIRDCCAAYGLNGIILRYFNAAGADPEGELGEYHDPETHLIPRCLQAAAGLIPYIDIYGDDYDTPDGSCVRDYIHVTDLARAHIASLEFLAIEGGCHCLNVGTGNGHSIFELLQSIRRVVGRKVPYTMRARRIGDPPTLIADGSAAELLLGFRPEYSSIETILRTAWRQYSHFCI